MGAITREDVERREHELLAPDACFADESLGRVTPCPDDPLRTCFQRDRDRIVHSKSFRRLAHKTQVFLAPEGDHYRTRLLHTLEVSQIARDISRSLSLNEDLTEAIALGHDLGHTPFGHTGESALSRSIALYRGIDPSSPEGLGLFRHNEQSVRVVEVLEKDGQGLNLCRETIDGIRCHTGNLRAMTEEGRVVAVSDRIAYVNHDIDDAIRAGLLSEEDLPRDSCAILGDTSTERITTMVSDLVENSVREGDVVMSPHIWDAMMSLRSYLFEHIYSKSDAKVEEPKANLLVSELFDHYVENMDEVPEEYRKNAVGHPEIQVADYISCMTDRYAIRTFEQIKVPHAWSLDRTVG
ncbi:MAG: deoxyguanosinetriphosphate triphosphohydrolase [Atopobiaceae bacterium]|jgi:dGTPase|nr:deoxyguanosinetriphosphate triphosphohydrolase [Atopobiaceae bacterium]MCI2173168.1 deoxyguanosinetriphosphate triphosphohydrolase [Atopobiaceae bacterium]MCI2208261.1 deoxyguanosinetriphosphate triphosphohydrolase [Atopobiaceae bacterium]